MFAEEVMGEQNGLQVPTVMTYDEDDPWVVMFSFVTGGGIVDWEFSRELLNDALLSGESGFPGGDVRFAVDGDILVLTLDSNETLAVKYPIDAIQNFVNNTAARVPFGTEESHMDLDAEWREYVNDETL